METKYIRYIRYKSSLLIALFSLGTLFSCAATKQELAIWPTSLWPSEERRLAEIKKTNPNLAKMVENGTQSIDEAEKQQGIKAKRVLMRRLFFLPLVLCGVFGIGFTALRAASPNWCPVTSFCPFSKAIERTNLVNGIVVNKSLPLLENGHLAENGLDKLHEKVQIALDKGANGGFGLSVPSFDDMVASIKNDQLSDELLDQWLASGGTLDKQNQKGTTLLAMAAYYGASHSAELLKGRGANVKLANNAGYTPVIIATVGNHTSVAETLINAFDRIYTTRESLCTLPDPIGLYAQDENNCTAITYADELEHKKIKVLLKEKGLTVGNALCLANCPELAGNGLCFADCPEKNLHALQQNMQERIEASLG